MRIAFTACFIMLVAGCSSGSGVPYNILPPPKMQAIIFDLLKADEWVNNYIMKDSSLKKNEELEKKYEQVFLIHKTNKLEFYKSYNYYLVHPDANKVLFDSLTSAGNKRHTFITPLKPVAK